MVGWRRKELAFGENLGFVKTCDAPRGKKLIPVAWFLVWESLGTVLESLGGSAEQLQLWPRKTCFKWFRYPRNTHTKNCLLAGLPPWSGTHSRESTALNFHCNSDLKGGKKLQTTWVFYPQNSVQGWLSQDITEMDSLDPSGWVHPGMGKDDGHTLHVK